MEPDYKENTKIVEENDNPLLWIAAFGVLFVLMLIWLIFNLVYDNTNSDFSLLNEAVKNFV